MNDYKDNHVLKYYFLRTSQRYNYNPITINKFDEIIRYVFPLNADDYIKVLDYLYEMYSINGNQYGFELYDEDYGLVAETKYFTRKLFFKWITDLLLKEQRKIIEKHKELAPKKRNISEIDIGGDIEDQIRSINHGELMRYYISPKRQRIYNFMTSKDGFKNYSLNHYFNYFKNYDEFNNPRWYEYFAYIFNVYYLNGGDFLLNPIHLFDFIIKFFYRAKNEIRNSRDWYPLYLSGFNILMNNVCIRNPFFSDYEHLHKRYKNMHNFKFKENEIDNINFSIPVHFMTNNTGYDFMYRFYPDQTKLNENDKYKFDDIISFLRNNNLSIDVAGYENYIQYIMNEMESFYPTFLSVQKHSMFLRIDYNDTINSLKEIYKILPFYSTPPFIDALGWKNYLIENKNKRNFFNRVLSNLCDYIKIRGKALEQRYPNMEDGYYDLIKSRQYTDEFLDTPVDIKIYPNKITIGENDEKEEPESTIYPPPRHRKNI